MFTKRGIHFITKALVKNDLSLFEKAILTKMNKETIFKEFEVGTFLHDCRKAFLCLLLDHGILHIETRDFMGTSLLGLATMRGQIGCVEELLKRGANVDHRDVAGCPIVEWAVRKNYGHVLDLLFACRPRIANARNSMGIDLGFFLSSIASTNGNEAMVWKIGNYCKMEEKHFNENCAFLSSKEYRANTSNDYYDERIEEWVDTLIL